MTFFGNGIGHCNKIEGIIQSIKPTLSAVNHIRERKIIVTCELRKTYAIIVLKLFRNLLFRHLELNENCFSFDSKHGKEMRLKQSTTVFRSRGHVRRSLNVTAESIKSPNTKNKRSPRPIRTRGTDPLSKGGISPSVFSQIIPHKYSNGVHYTAFRRHKSELTAYQWN